MNELDEGIKNKYYVERLGDYPGKHDECRYFVLDPEHDEIAREALMFYAFIARQKGYKRLSDQLLEWVAEYE